MKNKRLFLIITLSTITVLAISGVTLFGFSSGKTTNVEDKNQYEKVLLNASWDYNYSSVEELTNNSDLIALININKENLSTDECAGIPMSTYTAKVKESVCGCKSGDNVDIVMTGGVKDKKLYEVSDDPLMDEGDQYIIFAKKNKNGTYTILSGSQGRLEYKNGNVSSLNESNKQVMKYNLSS
ncbi:MAG: hypothetical protein ACI4RI_04120, partial [Ruminococcus sp.]